MVEPVLQETNGAHARIRMMSTRAFRLKEVTPAYRSCPTVLPVDLPAGRG